MSVRDFRLKFLGEMIPHVLCLLAQWPAGWKKEGGTNREREGKKAMGKKKKTNIQAGNICQTLFYLTHDLYNIINTKNIKSLDITVCGRCILLLPRKLK